MGCRLVTASNESSEQQTTELNHVTERISIDEQDPKISSEVPAETEEAKAAQETEPFETKSLAPRTVTSQLSDIVDLCEELEIQAQAKAEEVLERILRAQYQLEKMGDATSETATRVGDIDIQFQKFLAEYSNKKDDASLSAASDVLKTIEQELDVVTAELNRA
ncbi:hypothetical protein PHMEG_00031623 [Phytophthora megakarya]|uniref:Uncharacterized protein n=1 Tax=Phytophthora megakarya TaxID=4795 RepID=A0A225UYA6_9STRA|nr:hypothetical protein PHMEG_00031623 [Phytophthora megakarya]